MWNYTTLATSLVACLRMQAEASTTLLHWVQGISCDVSVEDDRQRLVAAVGGVADCAGRLSQ
jgi:hypothetical protein